MQMHLKLFTAQLNGKETEKRCVLRLDLNAGKVVDEVTSDGRLFQVFAAATGKARSPTCGLLEKCNLLLLIPKSDTHLFYHPTEGRRLS